MIEKKNQAWKSHVYRPTITPCQCGQMMVQVGDTTMLACHECGETRWLI